MASLSPDQPLTGHQTRRLSGTSNESCRRPQRHAGALSWVSIARPTGTPRRKRGISAAAQPECSRQCGLSVAWRRRKIPRNRPSDSQLTPSVHCNNISGAGQPDLSPVQFEERPPPPQPAATAQHIDLEAIDVNTEAGLRGKPSHRPAEPRNELSGARAVLPPLISRAAAGFRRT